MPNKRFMLWTGDGPFNASDEVIDFISGRIDLILKEAENGDPSLLNELIGYLHCLNGVLRETGGHALIIPEIENWRRRTLAVFDAIPNQTPQEIQEDRPFIISIFDDLGKASH